MYFPSGEAAGCETEVVLAVVAALQTLALRLGKSSYISVHYFAVFCNHVPFLSFTKLYPIPTLECGSGSGEMMLVDNYFRISVAFVFTLFYTFYFVLLQSIFFHRGSKDFLFVG
jgi:hypothetical protein